jgi:histone H3/H4
LVNGNGKKIQIQKKRSTKRRRMMREIIRISLLKIVSLLFLYLATKLKDFKMSKRKIKFPQPLAKVKKLSKPLTTAQLSELSSNEENEEPIFLQKSNARASEKVPLSQKSIFEPESETNNNTTASQRNVLGEISAGNAHFTTLSQAQDSTDDDDQEEEESGDDDYVEVNKENIPTKKKFSNSKTDFNAAVISRRMKTMTTRRVAKDSAVYMSGILQYLFEEIGDIVHETAVTNNHKRIRPRDIMTAIKNDEELANTFKNGIFASCGVIPHISSFLLRKGTKEKKI